MKPLILSDKIITLTWCDCFRLRLINHFNYKNTSKLQNNIHSKQLNSRELFHTYVACLKKIIVRERWNVMKVMIIQGKKRVILTKCLKCMWEVLGLAAQNWLIFYSLVMHLNLYSDWSISNDLSNQTRTKTFHES